MDLFGPCAAGHEHKCIGKRLRQALLQGNNCQSSAWRQKTRRRTQCQHLFLQPGPNCQHIAGRGVSLHLKFKPSFKFLDSMTRSDCHYSEQGSSRLIMLYCIRCPDPFQSLASAVCSWRCWHPLEMNRQMRSAWVVSHKHDTLKSQIASPLLIWPLAKSVQQCQQLQQHPHSIIRNG